MFEEHLLTLRFSQPKNTLLSQKIMLCYYNKVLNYYLSYFFNHFLFGGNIQFLHS